MRRLVDESLNAARMDQPGRLPTGFADGVMRRIAEAAIEYRVPLLVATKAGFSMSAAVAVLAAVVIARSGSEPLETEVPPPSQVFGLPTMAAPISK